MKVAIVRPIIVTPDRFGEEEARFTETFRQFPPLADFYGFCHFAGTFIDEIPNDFANLDGDYQGEGRDIGGHQVAANLLSSDFEFAVFCSAEVYFHRPGWLARMVEAREKFGPGLYGGLASWENRPHLRTCFFGCDPKDFRAWPWAVNSREMGLEFESGKTGFWTWMQANGRKTVLVTWDEFYDRPNDWRKPKNGFRAGDQSDCLVWDRHTEIYANASPEEKLSLERLANGVA